MAEYILDTSGAEKEFTALDAFTQAYIEALFWTEEAPGVSTEEWLATDDHDGGSIPGDVGFADLAPEALAAIVADCAKFQADNAADLTEAYDNGRINGYDEASAGHDYWLTRNGHGAGFWDRGLGDVGDRLSAKAGECPSSYVYLGDDGKVHVA